MSLSSHVRSSWKSLSKSQIRPHGSKHENDTVGQKFFGLIAQTVKTWFFGFPVSELCKMFCKMGAWEGQWGTWHCIIGAAYFVHGFLVIQIDGGYHSVQDFFWVQWWGIPFSTSFCFCLWWWFSFCTRFCAQWLPPTSNANFKGVFFKGH